MFDFFRTTSVKRRITQLLSLAFLGEWSFYGIFRCPFAVPYIGCAQCPVIQCPGRSLWMWSWIIIGASALVFGRAFCGWVCPGGIVAEMLTMVTKARMNVRGIAAKVAASGKYIMLALSLYYFFVLNNPRWAVPIRTGEFFNSVWLTFEHANLLWLYKTIGILVIFFIGGSIIPRVWCRFLCPTGGLLDILNKVAFVKVTADESCTNCDSCRKTCSMDTRPAETNCINCGSCLSACPVEAVHYSKLPRKTEIASELRN